MCACFEQDNFLYFGIEKALCVLGQYFHLVYQCFFSTER